MKLKTLKFDRYPQVKNTESGIYNKLIQGYTTRFHIILFIRKSDPTNPKIDFFKNKIS